MAELEQRYEDNVEGKFFVDKSCIDCGLCSEVASNNFCRSHKEDHDIVYKQPINEQERIECLEALENCPVEAIGISPEFQFVLESMEN